MQITEYIYKSRSNLSRVGFYEDLVAMDFTAVTRVVCKLYNLDNKLLQTVDSNDSPSLITWTDTTVSPHVLNVINFDFGSLSLTGKVYAQVYVYDPSHASGQTLIHPRSDNDLLCFVFVDA